MRDWLVFASEQAIVVIDILALAVIFAGTVEACFRSLRLMFSSRFDGIKRRDVWLQYARWLVAGLTFQLAADIVETSIHSDWQSIGRIAAIAVIRTFLNYFLERDLGEIRARQREGKNA